MYEGRSIEHGRVSELLEKYQNPVATYRLQVSERMDLAQKTLNGLSDDQLHGVQRITDNILTLNYNGDIHNVANLLEMLVKAGVRVTRFEKIQKDIQTIYNEILDE